MDGGRGAGGAGAGTGGGWDLDLGQGGYAGGDAVQLGRNREGDMLEGVRYVWVVRVSSPSEREPVHYTQVLRFRTMVQPSRAGWVGEIPGTLLWGNYFALLPPSPENMGSWRVDVDERPPAPGRFRRPIGGISSVGPVGVSYPDLSPDGKQMVYVTNDGVWVDRMDGTAPQRLNEGFCRDPRWSPDGKQIAYAKSSHGRDPGGQDLDLDIWVCNAEGTNLHPVANVAGANERFPSWSPDGKWIAYRRVPGENGQFLWAVRPDGTERHPIVGTTVVGHPDYQVGFMGDQSWSPDGTKIVTVFSAKNAAGTEMQGIGTISPEGGVLNPSHVLPQGASLRLLPSLPRYSPDGTQVVYSAGGKPEDLGPRQRTTVWVTQPGSEEAFSREYSGTRANSFSWRAVSADDVTWDKVGFVPKPE